MLINISGGHDLTLHEVAEAARIISDAVDPDANIISGMVIEPGLEDAMKVTVIATGFDRAMAAMGERPRVLPAGMAGISGMAGGALSSFAAAAAGSGAAGGVPGGVAARQAAAGAAAAPAAGAAAPQREEPETSPADVPFYRKAIAHARPEDPNGFGPNWSNVDDYDIPTVLRKQMD